MRQRESSQDLPGYGSIDISSIYQPFKPLGWGVGKPLTLILTGDFNEKAAEVIFDCSAPDTAEEGAAGPAML